MLSSGKTTLLKIKQAMAVSPDKADPIIDWVRQRIDARYAAGRHDTVFPGKWYLIFSAREVARLRKVGGSAASRDALLQAAIGLLDLEGPWRSRFSDTFAGVMQDCLA